MKNLFHTLWDKDQYGDRLALSILAGLTLAGFVAGLPWLVYFALTLR